MQTPQSAAKSVRKKQPEIPRHSTPGNPLGFVLRGFFWGIIYGNASDRIQAALSAMVP